MVKTRLKYITISGCLVCLLSPSFAIETTTIELPKVPVATKVITIGGSEIKPREDRRRLDTTIPLPISKPKVKQSVVVPAVEKVEAKVLVVTPPKEVEKNTSPKVDVKPTEKKEEIVAKKQVPSKEIKKVVKQAVPVVAKTAVVKKVVKAKKVSDTGMTKNGRVSAYLRGTYTKADEVKKKLEGAGFKVLGERVVDKGGELTSIVFTNDALTKLADKKDRGFMASLRVLINSKDKEISISNPLYFSRAFMQDDHDEKVIKEVLTSINSAFDGLKNSKDRLKYTLLPKYQFMFAMPYFDDMIEVGSATSSQKLLEKIKGKNLVFSQTLSKNRILVGVKLPTNTASFIDKTGSKNAILLPYPVLLEDGVAKILDPKYYIALSYPKLKMSQFMKISAVPGEIEDDCKKIFN